MKIVVVGAGYAGVIAANTVARRGRDVEVTVVNPRPVFVERVRLHEQLAGTGAATHDLADMLRPEIDLVLGVVDRAADGVLHLRDGSDLDFDVAMLAVGSGADPMPGTIAMATWEGAEEAHVGLAALDAGSTVTVVGAGLTGIETVAEVAEARPDLVVRLVGPALGRGLSDGGRERVRRGLERLGVEILLDDVTGVEEAGSGLGAKVVLRRAGAVPSDLTLWALTQSTSDLATRSGLTVDASGRALVDQHLRSVDDERIFVIGDCATVPGIRMACATAGPMGAHAGRSIVRVTRGRSPRPFSMGFVGQAISIGRRHALVQAVRRDDSPRRLYLSGRAAAWVKELICRYALFGSRTTLYGWAPGPR